MKRGMTKGAGDRREDFRDAPVTLPRSSRLVVVDADRSGLRDYFAA